MPLKIHSSPGQIWPESGAMAGGSCEPEGFPNLCWWCPRERTLARLTASLACFLLRIARIGHPFFTGRHCSHACLGRRLGATQEVLMSTTINPYLQGNFAPVHEEVTATELPVRGHLPEALNGRYLRNGPNPVSPPEPATYHWFTGDGMVHGIRLRDGRAEWYRNRWVRSAEVARALGEEPAARPGARRHGLRGQHQRHRPRRAHVRHRGGRCAPLRAERRARHDRALRLRRHARRRLHRPPQAGPAHRRALRRLLLLRLGRRRRGDGPRRAGACALLPARDDGRTGQRARHGHHPAPHRPARPPRDLQHGRRRRRARSSRTAGRTGTTRASGSCPATATRPTSSGTTSSRATCSTP